MKFQKWSRQHMVFAVLLLVLVSLVGFNWRKVNHPNFQNQKVATIASPQPSGSDMPIGSLPPNDIFGKKSVNLPVSLSSPSQGSVMLHYFFNGTVKEVKQTGQGAELIMDDPGAALPPIMIAADTRISKITPPYGPNTSIPQAAKDLKAGQHVVVSIEYDLFVKQWLTRDILIPTDQNP